MTIHFGEKIVAPPTPSTPSKRRRRSSSERRGSSPMVFAPYRDADDGMEDQPLMHPYVDDDDTEEVDMYGSDEW